MKRSTILLSTVVLSLTVAGCNDSKPTAASTPTPTPTATESATPAPTDTAKPKYGDEPSAATASAPCGTKLTPDPAAAKQLPKGFKVVDGWTPTGVVVQGSTIAVHGTVKGTPADIPTVRDAAFVKLLPTYTKTGSDQEPGFEADGDFTPDNGNINVKTLCKDYLVLTYTYSK